MIHLPLGQMLLLFVSGHCDSVSNVIDYDAGHHWPHHYLFVEHAVSHLGKAHSRTSEEEQCVGSLTGTCQSQDLRGTLDAVRIIIANAYEALTTCHPWSKHIPGSISFNPHRSPLMSIYYYPPLADEKNETQRSDFPRSQGS